MKYGYMSDKGISRDNNEDYILINEEISLFLLADGMGGHSAGEIASEQACKAIMQFFDENRDLLKNDFQNFIQKSVLYANEYILKMVEEEPKFNGMGTTLVIFALVGNNYIISHLGDSRAYKFDGNNLIKLTKDHSLVQEMLDDKIISEEEAENHKLRNVITRSIGFPIEKPLEFVEGNLKEGEIILLCTDGLHDYVKTDAILSLLKESGVEASKSLIEAANQEGGHDNCSVVLISL